MTPSQLSARLRQIANAIDASKRPSRSRVAAALKTVLAAFGQSAEHEYHQVHDEWSKGIDQWEKLGELLDKNDFEGLEAATNLLYGNLSHINEYANFHLDNPGAEGAPSRG